MKPSHFSLCLIISFFGSILLTATAQAKETWHLTYDKGSGPVALGKDVILKLDSCKSPSELQTTAYLAIENNARTLCAESRKDLHIESVKYELTPDLKASHDDIPVQLFEDIECTAVAPSAVTPTKNEVNDLLKAYSKSLSSVSKEKTTCVKETSLLNLPSDVFDIIAKDLKTDDVVKLGQASKMLHQYVSDIPKKMLIDLSDQEIPETRWNALFGQNGLFHNAQYINLTNAHMDARLLESLPKTTKMLISKNLRHREKLLIRVLSALDPNKLPEIVHLEGLEFAKYSKEDQEKLREFKKLRRVGYTDLLGQAPEVFTPPLSPNYAFWDLPLDLRFIQNNLEDLNHIKGLKGIILVNAKKITEDFHLEKNETVRELVAISCPVQTVTQVLKACPNIESIKISRLHSQYNNNTLPEFAEALGSLKHLKNIYTAEPAYDLWVLPPSLETLRLPLANGNAMKVLKGKNIRRLKIEKNVFGTIMEDLAKIQHPELRELQIPLEENKFSEDFFKNLSAFPKLNHVYLCSQGSSAKEGTGLLEYEKAAKKRNLHLTFSVGCPNWEYELEL